MNKLTAIARQTPGVRHATAITGQSFVLNAFGSNFGSMFINLHQFSQRREPLQTTPAVAEILRRHKYPEYETGRFVMSSEAIADVLRERFNTEIYDAQVMVFGPPPIRGVGRAG